MGISYVLPHKQPFPIHGSSGPGGAPWSIWNCVHVGWAAALPNKTHMGWVWTTFPLVVALNVDLRDVYIPAFTEAVTLCLFMSYPAIKFD